MQQENTNLIIWASNYAESLLVPLGKRWVHVQGVVERAKCVSQALNEDDATYLITVAYLHDIGYAPSLQKTGFHPLDGACALQADGKDRLASLVAYHSESPFEAQLRGYTQELNYFPREHSIVADALTYCDMTTGPAGEHVTFEERIADILHRYGKASLVSQAIQQATPNLSATVTRVQSLLREKGLMCDA